MNHLDIVLARHNEDIGWVTSLTTKNVFVYDKGSQLQTLKENYLLEKLPNVGRESHTYLHHIVNNYKNLDPEGVTLFTQANPLEHFNFQTLVRMINEADSAENSTGMSVSNLVTCHRQYGCEPNFRILEYPPGSPLFPTTNETYGSWFTRMLDMPFPENGFHFTINGIFAIKNKQILKNTLEFYQKLKSEIPDTGNPEVGHFFERSWWYIFNKTA